MLAPVVFGLVFVGLWQLFVTALEIEPYIVPSPAAILAEFIANFGSVLSGALQTGLNALVGLVVGAVLGVLAAILANLIPVFDGLAAPAVAALAVMPIVALAPVLYTMYGADVDTARQLVAGLAVAHSGLHQHAARAAPGPAVHRDLMRALRGDAPPAAARVTLPTAAPYVFTGLRIASSLAVISALVAEYFGGPVGGLGKSITSAAASSNYPLAWAYVLGAILLGLVFYVAALGLETVVSRHRGGS